MKQEKTKLSSKHKIDKENVFKMVRDFGTNHHVTRENKNFKSFKSESESQEHDNDTLSLADCLSFRDSEKSNKPAEESFSKYLCA